MRSIFILLIIVIFTLACPTEVESVPPWIASVAYAQTKYAVLDGRDRYWPWMEDLADYVKKQVLPDKEGSLPGTDGCTHGWIHGSGAINKVANPVKSSFHVSLVDENAFAVSGRVLVAADVPGYLHVGYPNPLPFGSDCWGNKDVCGGYLHFAATVDFATKILLSIDATTKQLVVSNTQPQVTVVDRTFSGCSDLGWIIEMVIGSWDDIINRAIYYCLPKLLPMLVTSQGFPSTVNLAEKLYLGYAMDSLSTVLSPQTKEAELLVATTDTLTLATFWDDTSGKWVNQSITDDTERGQIRPPTNFSFPSDPDTRLLHVVRVSDSIFKTMFTASKRLGYLNYSVLFSPLDANITFHSEWSEPRFEIPKDGVLLVHIDSGLILGTCTSSTYTNGNDTSYNYHQSSGNEMLKLRFYNLTAQATIEYNGNDTDPGLVIQILSWEWGPTMNVSLDVPTVPLPEVILSDLIHLLMNYSTTVFNIFFYDHPFVLPEPLKPWIPNPRIVLRNQPGCCGNSRGYVEMTSFCKCTDDPTLPWRPCSDGVCSSSRKSQHQSTEEPTNVNDTDNTNGGDGDDQPFYAWYISYFNTSAGQRCTTNNPGDRLTVSLLGLSTTTKECRPMPADLSANLLPMWFQILDDPVKGEVYSSLFCSDNSCTNCLFRGHYLNGSDTISGCHQLDKATNISFGLQRLLASDKDVQVHPCVGGKDSANVGTGTDQENFYLGYYTMDLTCLSQPPQFQLGSISLVNLGSPTNNCSTMGQVDKYLPTRFSQKDGGFFDLAMYCDSRCSIQSCWLTATNLSIGDCLSKTRGNSSISYILSSDSFQLLRSSQMSNQCSFRLFAHNNLEESSTFIYVLVFLFVGVVVVTALAITIKVCKKNCQSNCHFEDATTFVQTCYTRCTKNTKIERNFNLTWGQPTTRDRVWDVISLALFASWVASLTHGIISLNMEENPWFTFNQNSLAATGLPIKYLNVDRLFSTLQTWGKILQVLTAVVFLLLLSSWWIWTCSIKPCGEAHFRRIMMMTGCVTIVVIFAFPLVVIFSNLVGLDVSNIEYMQRHPDFAHSSSQWASWGFASLAFTYVTDLTIFILHPFSLALVIACWLAKYRGSSTPTIPSPPQLKRSVVALSLVVLVCVPIGLVSSAITLHHILGASTRWLQGWAIHAITSSLGFYLITLVGSRENVGANTTTNVRTVGRQFFLLLPLLVAGTIYSLVLLLQEQRKYSFVSVEYIASLWFLSLTMIVLILVPLLQENVQENVQENLQVDTQEKLLPVAKEEVEEKEIKYYQVMDQDVPPLPIGTKAVDDVGYDDMHGNTCCSWLKQLVGTIYGLLLVPLKTIREKQMEFVLWQNVKGVVKRMRELWSEMEGTNDYSWPCMFIKMILGIPILLTFGLTFLLLPLVILSVLRVVMEICLEPHKDVATNRMKYRNVLLFVGAMLMIASLVDQARSLNQDVKVEFLKGAQKSAGSQLLWPTGHTFLDACFVAYDDARHTKFYLMIVAFSLFFLSILADKIPRKETSRLPACLLIYGGSVAVLLATIYPGLPDYLGLANIEQICKPCASQFDLAIRSVLGLLVGIASAALEEVQAAGILLSIVPTLVRVCFVMLLLDGSETAKGTKDTKDTKSIKASKTRETLKTLMVGISFLTPLITCIPMTILVQIFGSVIPLLPWLAISFWVLPLVWITSTIKRNLSMAYWGFMLLYLGHLVAILLVIVTSQGWHDELWRLVSDPVFLATFASTVAITNAALSDFLHHIIH